MKIKLELEVSVPCNYNTAEEIRRCIRKNIVEFIHNCIKSDVVESDIDTDDVLIDGTIITQEGR